MTYLHDYITARKTLQEEVIPKMIAALMPTMDFLKYEYVREGDSLYVTLPGNVLPEGYRMRIEFTAAKSSQWTAPDGTPVKGPGF